MQIEYPCGKDVIEQVLPHRDPFVWMTRVIQCDPGKYITAELDVSPDLDLFRGHFPEHAVLPGVILMVLQRHLYLHRGVATGVEDFPCVYFLDSHTH